MIEIDGAIGEGGGQILRSALALSMVTGQPFRIHNIRANRPKPGLMRQHLTAVQAATQVGGASVSGDAVGSCQLEFRPGSIRPGDYEFAIGTAGSTTLVLQTVLPALLAHGSASSVTVSGGTHNTHAPSVHFLKHAFLPILGRMGRDVDVHLERHGFYPAGGGVVTARVSPGDRLSPIELFERGDIVSRKATATVAGLPGAIAKRELAVIQSMLGWEDGDVQIEQLPETVGPGNVLSVELHAEHVSEVFTGFGERGVSAEKVADSVAKSVRGYLALDVPVWHHLADQLMLPMAIAGGGGFRAGRLSKHAETNADVIERFIPVKVHRQVTEDNATVVRIIG